MKTRSMRSLDLLVRVFDYPSARRPDQADRQGQGQLAALRLVPQTGCQAGLQGVQLQFGDQALEAEDQPAIGGGGVVDAVLVADQAGAESTQVEELIPIGAVAGQAGDVVGEDDADLLLVDQRHEFLEAAPAPEPSGRSGRDPSRSPGCGWGPSRRHWRGPGGHIEA